MSLLRIGQGWVSHHRPQKSLLAFRYPIYNFLFPVGQGGPEPLKVFGIPFARVDEWNYVDATSGSLQQKIEKFLKNECQYIADEIWLQTLPKIFGYVFNPISFWYCFKAGRLDAVLCEVNNTFGDRHFYFVPCENGKSSHWVEKHFHVSPFFDVKGKYQFSFDFSEQKTDVHIGYFDDNQKMLLDTRILLNIKNANEVSTISLFFKYGWLTLMVIGRIHYLAFKMWLKKAKFHHRPQPPERKVTM